MRVNSDHNLSERIAVRVVTRGEPLRFRVMKFEKTAYDASVGINGLADVRNEPNRGLRLGLRGHGEERNEG